MSLLKQFNLRSLPSLFSVRNFTTSRTVLSATETNTTKSTGLNQFFENGEALPKQVWTGRAWKASELRLKSFEDLHKLWYVLLKERNLLATQQEEASRLKLHRSVWSNRGRVKKCQKSMARIKFVLNERQRAYEATLEKQ
ncbi:mitochondrial 39-S ribosomal protein L47 (MRP-L47)-domain-containing protein [Cunninghamella echinulata]|nr:mitochondrial 39-S ribosomal protein L47 (MRP-L47)-domain-containing protein [Cunninghamella echinulata]